MAPISADLQIVLGEIQSLRADITVRIDQVRLRVEAIEHGGCGLAGSHNSNLTDHEARLRGLERRSERQVGAVVAVGATSGIIGGVLGWLGKIAIAGIVDRISG